MSENDLEKLKAQFWEHMEKLGYKKQAAAPVKTWSYADAPKRAAFAPTHPAPDPVDGVTSTPEEFAAMKAAILAKASPATQEAFAMIATIPKKVPPSSE